ncbi:MAG: ATP-dependent sacrificial sulfur transferase LarE [bacterium]|nr:ATP-dependent sacrificial sulfur transferase LarE [bacterium]
MLTAQEKLVQLEALLGDMKRVCIGYSGGVDSTFLAKVATNVLGEDALCIIAVSESYPEHERYEAEQFAAELGLHTLTVNTHEIDNPDYRRNDSMRCYHCKKEMVSHLKAIAAERRIPHILIGTNYDDLGDYRPGQQAAKEEGVRSPLVEVEMTKDDIRILSKEMNIPTWNKPSFACLSSRVPYGQAITPEILGKIDRAESLLREYGLSQFRVRHHDNLARIEVLPEEMTKVLDQGAAITSALKEMGYAYVTLDLVGYRTGSMNEVLHQIQAPARR